LIVRRVCVITGSRSEYGILRPILAQLSSQDSVDLEVLVAGMHLSSRFGHTVDQIVADGYPIRERVETLATSDTGAGMARSLGTTVVKLAESFEADPPDAVLVYGDRFDALAGAIAGAYVPVPVVHMHGGDTAAGFDIDDSNRHAITKFAHLHMPATERHAARIRRMGEDPDRIFVVGSPAIDSIRRGDFTARRDLAHRLGLPFERPTILVVQHPVTSQATDAGEQIQSTETAIRELALPTVWIFPNADSGSAMIIQRLEAISELPFVEVRRSVAHSDFLGLLAASDVLVGNSSSALIEAPSFGLPAINIGTRQAGRDRGENVIDVRHDATEILREVRRTLADSGLRSRLSSMPNLYGDGFTAERVGRILETMLARPEGLIPKPWFD
jgi:GDP/UDP-N,N'-diacetylbacillosamine 2-epimerase (hydrolysing)